jgi:probable rRNA maturation factor
VSDGEGSHPLTVDVLVEAAGWPEEAAALCRRAAEAAYRDVADPPEAASVTLLLADDATLQALNRDFRGKDGPTNVLSFPNDDPPMAGEDPFLGDMALARETLEREAAAQGKILTDHLTHLVVHGMLHLMGMDHEEAQEATAMEAREIAILETRFGIANPYQEETA